MICLSSKFLILAGSSTNANKDQDPARMETSGCLYFDILWSDPLFVKTHLSLCNAIISAKILSVAGFLTDSYS